MLRLFIAAALALGVARPAHAEITGCQGTLLGGESVIRDTTGAIITPFPYAAPGEALGGDYSFDLAGTGPVSGGGTVPAVSLEGTRWRLATLSGQPVQAETTLIFETDGRMVGDAPCNRYFGSYAQGSGVGLTFAQIGATRRACPALSEESAYFRALEQTAEFRIGREGDFLAFVDTAGKELATFSRDAGSGAGIDLTGSWRVTGVTIDGMLQTVSGGVGFAFTSDGRFSANLGCNTASGEFATDGQKLGFGTVAVTERQCLVPAPFEAPILYLLSRIRWVQPTGGDIVFQDGARQTLITLSR